jgi:hypothetical protein
MRLSLTPLLTVLPFTLNLALTHALPESLGPRDDLSEQACTPLSWNQCHATAGAKGGKYCGWCPQVQGTDWQIAGHTQ